MNYALWIIQVLLGLLFVFAGSMKFIMTVEEMTKDVAMPGWFLHFIGVAEVLGGLGLILPGLLRIRPGLTPLAAAGLVLVTFGATMYQVATGQPESAVFAIGVGLLAAFVAYGRWRLAPLRGSARPSALQPVG